jgi:hypothetical protein
LRTLARRPFPLDAVPARAFGETGALHIARDFELVAWILVLAARAPVFAAPLAPGAAAVLLPQREFRRFFRRPQFAAREPHHCGIRMARLQLLQRGQQLFALRRTKRRRLAAGDDRPVHVARWHVRPSMR